MNFDMNLIKVLDAVLSERSVSRAAVRLGVSQSAVSHALAKMRKDFQDPLFVRSPQGMVPTERAERMIPFLRTALAATERLLDDPEHFDPMTTRRSFTIAAADMFGLVLLPSLIGQLVSKAPGLDLDMRPNTTAPLGALENAALDLAIGVFHDPPSSLRRQRLFDDEFVCLVRRNHPSIQDVLTLDAYIETPHGLVAPAGRPGGVVDTILARQGLSRRVALRVPNFLVAPMVTAGTDLVWTLPSRIARIFADYLPLRIFPPPIDIPTFTISQLWHERSQHDPGHRFLRSTMAAVARDE